MNFQLQNFRKTNRFNDLVESVQHCNLCPRLCERRKVLSEANGNLESKVLFVAEAPGRLGADRTGVPLYGDRTGDNFEVLLGNVGWYREQIFITNAVLCNPRDDNGTNTTPTSEEIANCSAYLEMIIALIKPDVIVTLGTNALKALEYISPHGIQLRDGVAKLVPWYGSLLFPLYHPGPRATVHRSLGNQRVDFMRLAKLVHPKKGLIIQKNRHQKSPKLLPKRTTTLQQLVLAILELLERMTYFKITKLLYLIDLLALKRLGHTVASDIYIRQVDGPWPPKLDETLKAMEGYEVRRYFSRRIPIVALGPSPRFKVQLNEDILELVEEICIKYRDLSNSSIKTAVYLTKPMRFILAEEKRGKNMTNKPVLYKNKTAAELEDQ